MTDVTAHNHTELLESEIRVVFHTLENAINELHFPLSKLVNGQIKQTFSPLRAGIILVAGINAVDTPELRNQRIHLAAALEMLHVALSIHKLLITDPRLHKLENTEKSRIGSIILAGDYCFSRSAILAAYTNNPQVVKQFANALKAASEGHLRNLFKEETTFQEDSVLIEAGLTAATILTNTTTEWATVTLKFGKEVLSSFLLDNIKDTTHLLSLLPKLPPWQQPRWLALLASYASASSAPE